MEVKLHFKSYYVFTKYKYISQQLKMPTVQQGTTIWDVLRPNPSCKMPGTPPSSTPWRKAKNKRCIKVQPTNC